MTLRYAYTRPDGGVSIVIAAPKKEIERVLGPMSDKDYRNHVLERSIPKDATNLMELPDDWKAPDRSLRDAWAIVKGKIRIDKARLAPDSPK